jgi:uridine kinase
MLGDVLLLTAKHKRIALELVSHVLGLERPIISISGESGSGKSEVAHYLAEILKETGKRAKIMHTDNYYRIPPQKRRQWREDNGIANVGFDEYDWDYINSNILSYRTKTKAIMPCLDRLTDQMDQLITDFRDVDVLILEGLYAIKAESDLKVMIKKTYHHNQKAQIKRGKEVLDEFRLAVLEREHVCVQSLKKIVDIFISSKFTLSFPKKQS